VTQRQRVTVAVVTALVAVTRWLALSRTLWDWDEAQFILALRHFDVAAHHPHPPGFPLFIATARSLCSLGFDEFHALQAINFIAAVAIVPAMVLFARALGAEFSTALLSAVILACFPNVWFYGGTALSDVPSMTLIVLAVGLLLSNRLYLGAIVLGVAAGIRPQNLLIAAVPFAIAIWQHRRRAVPPMLIAGTIVAISYGAAIYATGGWEIFARALQTHQEYLARFDAWTSPTRPPLTHLVDDFFIRPYRAQLINILTTLLVAIAAGRRTRPTLLALATFGPFCIAAWLMLDRFSASRFAVGYAPLFAILAADALSALKPRLKWIIGGAYVALMIVWTWPALEIVHTTVSPPVAAANWILASRQRVIYVDPRMSAFADALLPDVARRSGTWSANGEYLLSDRKGEVTFRRRHGHLWDLARQRYFEASVTPVHSPFRFGDGWYALESSRNDVWRWMRRRSTMQIAEPCTTLSIDFYVPDPRTTITLSLDGRVIDRVPGSAEFPRTYRVTAPRELVVESDRWTSTGDTRELALRLNGLECR